jgi:hypothetical protein
MMYLRLYGGAGDEMADVAKAPPWSYIRFLVMKPQVNALNVVTASPKSSH